MECFAKIIKSCNYFSKALSLRSLRRFWIHPSLKLLKWPRTLYYIKHIHNNPAQFRILTYLEPEIYSELCQGIILASSEYHKYIGMSYSVVYWEPFHIQNFNPVYLVIFRDIQAYSLMIVIIVTLTVFFQFNLTYFSIKFKKTHSL